jgi:post-segregation antitoxin (ccd killing protein)
MAKVKVSVTVDPDRLARARALSGSDNVSEVVDAALAALIDRELEQRWLDRVGDLVDLPGEVPVDLGGLPWAP